MSYEITALIPHPEIGSYYATNVTLFFDEECSEVSAIARLTTGDEWIIPSLYAFEWSGGSFMQY